MSAAAAPLITLLLAGVQPTELVPSHTIEGRVAPGATLEYTIFLDAGQYLALELEHDAVPVSFSLRSPSGTTLVSVGVNHPLRPERLAAVAEETGAHRVAVSARAEGEEEATHRLSVTALREATPSDRIRARALHVVAETRELREKSDRESLSKARSLLEEALADWRAPAIGSRRGRHSLFSDRSAIDCRNRARRSADTGRRSPSIERSDSAWARPKR